MTLYSQDDPLRQSTSMSDNDSYNTLCAKAAADGMFFDIFRRHPIYMHVVEGLEPNAALQYLNIAINRVPAYDGMMDEFRRNDLVGGPIRYEYPPFGTFAPVTLRYIKVAADIHQLFGALAGAAIAEIGVGYGGQCRILSALHPFQSYTLYDLPNALALSRRYLDHYGLDNVRYEDVFDGPDREYDLVISNYAFSELRKPVQEVYLDNVIARSKHGYLTYNQEACNATHPDFAYTKNEILARIPGCRLIEGEPALPKHDVDHRVSLICW